MSDRGALSEVRQLAVMFGQVPFVAAGTPDYS
jgi:hypothetical protein